MSSKISRFAVNLTCGRSPTSDIAFHLNPRLQQHYVVRNSRLNGQWGEEETTSPIKFDFERNKKFNLSIFIGEGEFLVSLDGVHVCSYRFRVALGKVSGIDVQGGVDVHGVEYKQLEIYPEGIPQNKAVTVALGRRQDDGDATETAM
ncbi:Gal-bind lectin domain containing protein, partial [Asbolus verrucosus]